MQTIGVIFYKFKEDGSLHGEWTIKGEIGHEIAHPQDQKKELAGTYNVKIYKCKNQEIYQGTLEVRPVNEKVFHLRWTGENLPNRTPATFEGYGIWREDIGYLAANYWSEEQTSNPVSLFFKFLFGLVTKKKR